METPWWLLPPAAAIFMGAWAGVMRSGLPSWWFGGIVALLTILTILSATATGPV